MWMIFGVSWIQVHDADAGWPVCINADVCATNMDVVSRVCYLQTLNKYKKWFLIDAAHPDRCSKGVRSFLNLIVCRSTGIEVTQDFSFFDHSVPTFEILRKAVEEMYEVDQCLSVSVILVPRASVMSFLFFFGLCSIQSCNVFNECCTYSW